MSLEKKSVFGCIRYVPGARAEFLGKGVTFSAKSERPDFPSEARHGVQHNATSGGISDGFKGRPGKLFATDKITGQLIMAKTDES